MEIDDALRIVRRALPLYGFDADADVVFIKQRENHVFRADLGDTTSIAVRLHRPGYRDEDEILTEAAYLDALGTAGVAVPRVLRALDGTLVTEVSSGGETRFVSMQRWIDDATPFGDVDAALSGRHDPPAESFAEIGRTLARMHAACARIGIPSGFRRGAWDAAGLAGDDPLWGDPRRLASLTASEREAVDGAMALLRDRLDSLGVHPEIFGVIHADATPENVLETPAGIVLIDFDDFGTGWYAFDLVTAVFHHAIHPRFAEFEEAVRSGYGETRPLTAVEEAAWDDLMLARGLTYLGWAAERPGDPASDFVSARMAPWIAEAAGAAVAGDPAPWRRRIPAPRLQES